MFTINVSRKPHRVDFKHEVIKSCPVTICVISNHTFVAMGKAVCDGVNLSKNKRRKIALKEALENAHFDRRVRARFWRRYFSARGATN